MTKQKGFVEQALAINSLTENEIQEFIKASGMPRGEAVVALKKIKQKASSHLLDKNLSQVARGGAHEDIRRSKKGK